MKEENLSHVRQPNPIFELNHRSFAARRVRDSGLERL